MKSRKEKSKLKTTDIVYIGVFAAVIAVCSWISIPLTVPITLQTMGICVCAGLHGADCRRIFKSFWQKSMGVVFFNDFGNCRLLCIRNGVVYDRLCRKK